MTIEEAKRCLVQILEATVKYEEYTGKDTMSLQYHIPYFQSVIETIIKELNADYPNWIPCSEQLPDEYDEYLCQDADGDRFVGWLENAEWCKKHVVKWNIVAWMPLPEPYIGD